MLHLPQSKRTSESCLIFLSHSGGAVKAAPILARHPANVKETQAKNVGDAPHFWFLSWISINGIQPARINADYLRLATYLVCPYPKYHLTGYYGRINPNFTQTKTLAFRGRTFIYLNLGIPQNYHADRGKLCWFWPYFWDKAMCVTWFIPWFIMIYPHFSPLPAIQLRCHLNTWFFIPSLTTSEYSRMISSWYSHDTWRIIPLSHWVTG